MLYALLLLSFGSGAFTLSGMNGGCVPPFGLDFDAADPTAPLESVAFTQYNSSFFNALPDITYYPQSVLGVDDDTWEKIQVLLAIIEKHGLDPDVGISLLHNHFAVSGDEEKVVMSPLSARSFQMEVRNTTAAIPYMFGLSSGGWAPLQFWNASGDGGEDGESETGSRMSHVLQDLVRFPDFATELAMAINSLNASGQLGFYVRYEHEVLDNLEPGEKLLEKTSVEMRRQVMVPVRDKRNEAVTATHFYFPVAQSEPRQHRCITDCDRMSHHTCVHCGLCHHYGCSHICSGDH